MQSARINLTDSFFDINFVFDKKVCAGVPVCVGTFYARKNSLYQLLNKQ